MLVRPLFDLFLLGLVLGTTLHALALRTAVPGWSAEVLVEMPGYAGSGLDAEATAALPGSMSR